MKGLRIMEINEAKDLLLAQDLEPEVKLLVIYIFDMLNEKYG